MEIIFERPTPCQVNGEKHCGSAILSRFPEWARFKKPAKPKSSVTTPADATRVGRLAEHPGPGVRRSERVLVRPYRGRAQAATTGRATERCSDPPEVGGTLAFRPLLGGRQARVPNYDPF